jgi:hypothetical protein
LCASWAADSLSYLWVGTTSDAEPTHPTGDIEEGNLMSEVLILEFAGATADQYLAVNKILGVDAKTGEGDWPAPLQSHVASVGAAGLVVVEVWESQEAQAAFMARLGPALGEVGLPQPARMEWLSLLGRYNT